MVPITTTLANSHNYGGSRLTSAIKYIVIHYTANDGDTDANNANYFKNNALKSPASAHYFVDSNSITQSVMDNYVAYHCGASTYKHPTCRNANSIGIELCDDVKNGTIYPTQATINNALDLVAYLMKKYSVPKANVIRHYDVTGKLCPAYWCGSTAKDSLWKTEFWNRIGGAVQTSVTSTPVKIQQYGVDLSKIDHIAYIPMNTPKGETVSSAAVRKIWNNRCPDIVLNAELFNMTTYAPSSGVVNNGKNELLSPVVGVAFVDGKKPVLSYQNNVHANDWLGSYPVLVKDGKVGFAKAPIAGKHAWTAVAWNNAKVAALYVKANDACTLEDFAKGVIAKGYTTAINFDGGGSTACITPLVAYDQGRKVRGKVGIWIVGGTGNILSNKNVQTATASSYKVKITADVLNVRKGPSTSYAITTSVKKNGVFTIVEENNGWGRLKSGAGWISLKYTTKL